METDLPRRPVGVKFDRGKVTAIELDGDAAQQRRRRVAARLQITQSLPAPLARQPGRKCGGEVAQGRGEQRLAGHERCRLSLTTRPSALMTYSPACNVRSTCKPPIVMSMAAGDE